MTDLDLLFRDRKPGSGGNEPSPVWEARVARVTDEGAYVIVPNYDRKAQWGPCLPTDASVEVDQQVAVAFSDNGAVWFVGGGGGGGGGGTGPPGPAGPPGAVQVYEQPGTPTTPTPDEGALWIDTDAPDPDPGGGGDGFSYWTDVKAYGAAGDDTADDTAEIQAAIDACDAEGGGTVFFPRGIYKISTALTLRSFVALIGEGDGVSVIHQTSTTAHCLSGTARESITIADLKLLGPASGSGCGIHAPWTSPVSPNYRWTIARVGIYSFGSHGIYIENAIVSHFDRVMTLESGGDGFYITGVLGGAAGTSCSFTACYANGNALRGYRLQKMTYCHFDACAADSNGIGYDIMGCQGVTLTACGAESQEIKNGLDGTSFKIEDTSAGDHNYGIGVHNCWTFNQPSKSLDVVGSQFAIEIFGFAENTPDSAATACVEIDNTVTGTVSDISNDKPNSIGSEITVINDGGGGMTTNFLTSGGANMSGQIYFTRPNLTDSVLRTLRATETTERLVINTNGALVWGDGSSGAGQYDSVLYRSGATRMAFSTDLAIETPGKGLCISEGANAKMGTATLNGTTAVTISTTAVTAGSRIFLTIQQPGGTVGSPYVSARTAGTSFQIKSTDAG